MGPVVIAGVPVGEQIRDEIIDIKLLAQRGIGREVVGIGGHVADGRHHGVIVRAGAAAEAAVDDAASVMLDRVIFILVATE